MADSKRAQNLNSNRGIGHDRFQRLVKSRESKKLNHGDHLLFHHALRCLCQRCERLLDWSCPDDLSYTVTECCGIEYKLLPWTVKIETKDVSSRPILPKIEGSSYSDPSLDLSSRTVWGSDIRTIISKPLSPSQLRQPDKFDMPKGKPQAPITILLTKKAKKIRKCSNCKKPGHDRRKCPD